MNTVTPWGTLGMCWGWALLHTVWMLAVIALAASFTLASMRRSTAAARYAVLVAAMALMAFAPAAALYRVAPPDAFNNAWSSLTRVQASDRAPAATTLPKPALRAAAPLTATPAVDAGATPSHGVLASTPMLEPVNDLRRYVVRTLDPALPWLLGLWTLGVFCMSARLAFGGFWVARARSRAGVPVAAPVLDSVARLCEALRLSRPIRVLKSTLVEVPTLLGWLKPVILLPPSALAGLTPRQLEMVLAHELAHLVRHDPLLNVIQSVVEVVLFYHPAVWWVSRRIREERELCCDDRALALCGERYAYAHALAYLEAQRSGVALQGLSAAGGTLLQRIRRVLTPADCAPETGRWATGLALLVALSILLVLTTVRTGSIVLAQRAPAAERTTPVVIPSGAGFFESPTVPVQAAYTRVSFPNSPVGTLCARRPGTDSFYDWRELQPAEGNTWLPPDAEYALQVAAEQAGDLSFLDTLPADGFAGLLLGLFPSFRAGNEPPDVVYRDVLQTPERSRMPVYDADLGPVARLTGLRELYLDHAYVGDAGIAMLQSLVSLDTLSLVDTEITDEALRLLGALPSLRRVNLNATAVTDRGLAYLATLPTLEDISLDRTAVTDAGIALLASLPNLRRLSVNFTAVTDEGVRPLEAVATLRELRTWRTGVSAAAQAASGHGTGAAEYGLATPRVGILLSDYNARTGYHRMPYEYTYRNPAAFAEVLIDLGYDLYAVIEPGTQYEGPLPEVLARLGLEDRTVDCTDPAALSQLDVIFSGFDADVLDDTMAAMTTAIKGGVGFVNTSLFGAVVPVEGAALSEILGIDNIAYRCPRGYVECPVLNSHPILAEFQPGDIFVVSMLNGLDGTLRGTPLLGKPADDPESAWPLYVYDLGRGRVVNLQCQKISTTNGSIDPLELYSRCVNFAAGVPVDATW